MPPATSQSPPTIDPVAARRWALQPRHVSAWLHEEVARRMAERLDVIRLPVRAWADWEPVRGGLAGHQLVAARYPDAACFQVLAHAPLAPEATKKRANDWWRKWSRQQPEVIDVAQPPAASVQLVWANMLAHHSADPVALMGDWHRALAVDGFVMFSCLGPDTLQELRALYARLGWPPPAHEFTDMHDWGDQLVAAGFAEPVMDMETLTLQFDTPERLLAELRGLGRNLGVARFAGLRGRQWRQRLLAEMDASLRQNGPDGPLSLSFEVIYGHAIKGAPRHAMAGQTHIALDDMRASLRRRQ